MIQNLEIQNFKSIKNLKLLCKKVNVFIGEPNAGKTNIIEALALLSEGSDSLKEVIRYRGFAEVFFNKEVSQQVKIFTDIFQTKIFFDRNEYKVEIVKVAPPKATKEFRIGAFDSSNGGTTWSPEFETPIRYYQYKSLSVYRSKKPGALSSPFGDNLIACISTSEKARDIVGDIYKKKGLKLLLDEERGEISLIRDTGNISNIYSFEATSETLKRVTFFRLALETNQNKILVFDEPEANLFPFYTKHFAERLAYDETNQFFFSTHNPYLIEAIIAKTKPENLNVIVTHMDNYETKIRILTEQEILEAVDSDIFFNLKLFTEPA